MTESSHAPGEVVVERDFSQYVADLERVGSHVALRSRRFVAIERLTHHQLAQRAYQTARYLADQGVARGDRVMVVAPNAPQWITLVLGTQLLGAILVPVDVASTTATLDRALAQTEPRLIFTAPPAPSPSVAVATRPLDDLDHLVAAYPTTPLDERPTNMTDWPGLIVFTSGTTAAPKGVVLTQGNVLANIDGILERIEVQPTWRFLSVLPLSHMYEFTGTLAALSRGASVAHLARVTPSTIAEGLVDYEVTAMLAMPQLLTLMLRAVRQQAERRHVARPLALALRAGPHLAPRARRALFSPVLHQLGDHLDLVVTGGAPIPLDVAAAWEAMGVRLVQGYGLTETSPILTCNPLDGRRQDSPGRALANVALRLGEDDEVQARGPSVFSEYWRDPDATRAAFTSDGWFRTGDVGRLDDGWLSIVGRLKFAIVRASGLKVFPEDVEAVAEHDTRVRELCVVGVRDEHGEHVEAVVLGDTPDEVVNDVVASVNAQLASFQHIDHWRRWPGDDFPRTRLLKVDRRAVQDWANAGSAPPALDTDRAPLTADPVARAIRLSLDDPAAAVRDDDRLSDLGLDSLLRLNVVSLLEEELGLTLSDESVTESTTVAQLRDLVDQGESVEGVAREPTWTYRPAVRHLGDALRDHVIARLVGHWVSQDVVGLEHLADLDGPAIFIFNHTDDFDAPVIYRALPPSIRRRLAVATAADVMANHRLLAFIARLCFAGFAFARQEPYLRSLEYVGRMIDRGWNVLIAPEGRLSTTGELQDFKSGIGLLAANLGVPIVPLKTVGLAGTVPLHAKWPRRHSHVVVRIGVAQRVEPTQDYDAVTAMLHQTMSDL
jgi:long-chain acyl-CoA synthetase